MYSRIGSRLVPLWMAGMAIALVLSGCNESGGTSPLSAYKDGAESAALTTSDWEENDALMGPPRPEGGRFDPLRMGDELELTEEQTASIEALREEIREAMQALHEQFRNGEIDRDALRSGVEALHESQQESLSGILTDVQLALLDSMRDERALERFAERLDRLGDRDAAERVERMAERLGLDEAQTNALVDLFESTASSEAAILQSALEGEITPEEAREALQNLRDSTRTAMEEILTDEQLEMLEEMRPQQGGPGGPGGDRRPEGRGGPRGGGRDGGGMQDRNY